MYLRNIKECTIKNDCHLGNHFFMLTNFSKYIDFSVKMRLNKSVVILW